MVAVLSAVCDSVVAEAFRTKHDVKRVTASVSAFEHAVYRQLAATRQRKDADAMQDSDTAELSAGLVRIVHLHDRETAIHLDATGILARRIAQAMDLSDEQVVTIELAARLHDIGKVGVRKDVLCKPGSLADDEWTEMRLHAEIGAAVLSETPKLAHLAAIVRAHHERIDGAGYPDRLAGEEIPIEARVIAVADAFHAMTTVRPYRAALLPNDALEVLAEHAGQQFDADVVEATFELFRYVPRSQRAIA
jgi:HD-GYP domain-containing protein (c-di-GMP phosphodiesterase class II)